MINQEKVWHTFLVRWTEKDGTKRERRYGSFEWPYVANGWLNVGVYSVSMRLVKADSIEVLYGGDGDEPTSIGKVTRFGI